MKAKDLMSQPVITVAEDASVLDAVGLMLRHKISGLPVVNASEALVGMVTEGDFLHRVETGTQPRHRRWIEFLLGPGKLATEYVHSSGRKVDEVMSTEVHAVQEDAPVEDIVRLMERYGIKRVPVLRGERLAGIVTRANLMRALISATRAGSSATKADQPVSTDDASIRARLIAELEKQPWAPIGAIEIGVDKGVVTLSGVLTDDRQRHALCVAAENTPGVKKVTDRLVWVVSGTGIVGGPPVIVGPPDR